MLLQLKSKLVGTPFGSMASSASCVLNLTRAMRHPELIDIYLEPWRVRKVLRNILPKNATCIDVGAHIGSFTSFLWKLCPNGNVIAIEASPQKCNWLRSKFRGEIIQAAVSDTNGLATFCEDMAQPGYSRLAGSSPIVGAKNYEVRTATLDTLLTCLSHIDFIKLDIEGVELAALRGAKNIISRHRPIILFECGSDYEPTLDRRGIFDLLTEASYSIFVPKNLKSPLTFDEFKKCGLYPFHAFNFFAKPNLNDRAKRRSLPSQE